MLSPQAEKWGDVVPSSPTDRRPCCEELPNPIFWQRNLSSLKWEYVTQSAGIRRFGRRQGVNVKQKFHNL